MNRLWMAAILGFFAVSGAGAGTLMVTNTNDSGPGSLRQAILDANANPGLDTIAFAIPGAGVHTIAPTTNYATIVEAVVIDGYTQPGTSVNTDPVGTNAVLLIELDGTAMAGGGLGLNINSPTPTTVRGLVMNRWGALAIQTAGTSVGAVITGNFLGTDPTGAIALPNGTAIGPGGTGSMIGGATPAERNLISGNSHGIYVQEHGTVIRGNLIGTDATGMLPLGNTQSGVFCANFGGTGTTIGGSGAGQGNVISGNLLGIALSQGFSFNTLQGNKIGVNAAGTGPLGNKLYGIATTTGGLDNVIGGTGPGEANEIAYNQGEGVRIDGGGVDDSIRGNSIHDNGGLGIALGGGGPHFNDALDADDGPNHAQNFPIVRSVEHLGQGGGSTRVLGKFNSTPSTAFTLDFYANSACSNFPREFVEGAVYLGSAPSNTDASGHAAIDVTLPVQTEAGARISVTATDPNGNTSEFSQRILFSIFPVSGPSAGGTPIQASGTDFADPTTLSFGGTAATVTFLDDHTLTTTSPALPPGTVNDVVATTPDGTVGVLFKGWVSDFLDVPGGHGFYSFVTTLVSNGITVGVGGGLYGVDQPTLREQMAVFLLKSEHGLCYTPPPCASLFTDVPCPATPQFPFSDWIEQLFAEGITAGCDTGKYCPENPVNRDQMAVFLLKTEHGPAYTPPGCTGLFTDVPCPATPQFPFSDWIERLFAEGITAGCDVGLYCPDRANTRGEMAVFLVKTFGLL